MLTVQLSSFDSKPTNDFRSPMKMTMNIHSRLDSFACGWPHRSISPEDLAKNGFYYTKQHDQVRCAYCDVQLEHLSNARETLKEHRRRSPHCPVVKQEQNRTPDTCGPYGIPPSDGQRWRPRKKERRRPEYPGFTLAEKRKASFLEWPRCMKQKVEDLVEAGFFYTGRGDKAICFHCGLGLNEWEEEDVPWVEHAKWASDCEFLLMHKGEDFVKTCKEQSKKYDQNLNNGCENNGASSFVRNNGESKKNCDTVEKNIDENVACKICFEKKVGVAFEPCGHTSCVDCAFSLNHCHMCRAPIQKTIKLYI